MKLILLTTLATILLASGPASADRSSHSDRSDRYEDDDYSQYYDQYNQKRNKQYRKNKKHKHTSERSQLDWAVIFEFSNISGLSLSHVEIIFDQYQHQGLAMVAFKLGISRSSSGFRRISSFSSFNPWIKRIDHYNVRSFDRVTLDRYSRR